MVGGKRSHLLGCVAPPGPRGPQCPPNCSLPSPSRVGPARLSQPRSGPARPRPLPTARGRPARLSRSYKSRLRARGPGHSEQLRRGDCTARPAGPAPTGARRLQQPQHRDLGPRAGYGCALGLNAQVGRRAHRGESGERDGGNARGEVGGRAWASCFGWVSLGRFSLEQAAQPGAARGGNASHSGSRALPLELGRKLGKVGKSFRGTLCSGPYFS